MVGIVIMLRFPITRRTHEQIAPSPAPKGRRNRDSHCCLCLRRTVLARSMIFRGAQVLALEAHAAGESAIDPLTRRSIPPPPRVSHSSRQHTGRASSCCTALQQLLDHTTRVHEPPGSLAQGHADHSLTASPFALADQRITWILDTLRLHELRTLCEAVDRGSNAGLLAARRLRRAIVLRAAIYGERRLGPSSTMGWWRSGHPPYPATLSRRAVCDKSMWRATPAAGR